MEGTWFDDWTISEDLDKILTDRKLKKYGRKNKKCYTKDYVEDAMLEANIFEPERWDVDSPKFVLKDEKVDTWDKVIKELVDFKEPEPEPVPEPEPEPEPEPVSE
tara:strand:+ start:144 stop:458 length:315 start_codon:yes stop_codon:yes gene_type:complete